MDYKNELKVLRQTIPIGLQDGLILLEQTEGNIEEAKILFQEQVKELLIIKPGLSKEVATQHLILNDFNLEKSLVSINEERYTLTERILKKYANDKQKGLEVIRGAIEETENLKREFWLEIENLSDLNPYQYCLVLVIEWINFEEWEGFGSALNFNLELIIQQIRTNLLFYELADNLQKALKRKEEIYFKHQEEIDWITICNKFVKKDEEFSRCEKYYSENKSILIDYLYQFVSKNVNNFL